MLWALLALYFFSSSGTTDRAAYIERMKDFIKADIQDSGRRAELLDLAGSAERSFREQMTSRVRIVKALSKVSERHETRAADIRPLLDAYSTETTAFQERMIRLRFELKKKMTREEWAKAFPSAIPAPEKK